MGASQRSVTQSHGRLCMHTTLLANAGLMQLYYNSDDSSAMHCMCLHDKQVVYMSGASYFIQAAVPPRVRCGQVAQVATHMNGADE